MRLGPGLRSGRIMHGLERSKDGSAEINRLARAQAIVVAQDRWVESSAWWLVGVPEVSEPGEVLVTRAEWGSESQHHQIGV